MPVQYWSVDRVGNAETAKCLRLKIDTTAPTITAHRDTAANANGWNKTDVASSYNAGDGLSGLLSPAAGSFTFTAEGANQSYTFMVTDLAGE